MKKDQVIKVLGLKMIEFLIMSILKIWLIINIQKLLQNKENHKW